MSCADAINDFIASARSNFSLVQPSKLHRSCNCRSRFNARPIPRHKQQNTSTYGEQDHRAIAARMLTKINLESLEQVIALDMASSSTVMNTAIPSSVGKSAGEVPGNQLRHLIK
jgi:hypothetical protein